jgi:hypothetical protein
MSAGPRPRARTDAAVLACFLASCGGPGPSSPTSAAPSTGNQAAAPARWAPDHIVIVFLENKSFQQLIGSRDMPYLNSLAQAGALMTNAYAAETPYRYAPPGFLRPFPTRPSQANYLTFFGANNQGTLPEWFQSPGSPFPGSAVHDQYGTRLPATIRNTPVGVANNLIPANRRPFVTPNLGAAMSGAGRTFATYSSGLPYPHFDGATFNPPGALDGYARRHNPAINWINLTQATVPAEKQRFLIPVESNLGFEPTVDPTDGKNYGGFAKDSAGRPRDYALLPTVSLVIPTNDENSHTGSQAAADAWLAANIKPYLDWAKAHNSLLVVTADEDGSTDSSQGAAEQYGTDPIVTLFLGPEGKVLPGRYLERVDHLNLLATVLDFYGALPQFVLDFSDAHLGTTDSFRAAEHRRLLNNLRPILDVFLAGPALTDLPFVKAQ